MEVQSRRLPVSVLLFRGKPPILPARPTAEQSLRAKQSSAVNHRLQRRLQHRRFVLAEHSARAAMNRGRASALGVHAWAALRALATPTATAPPPLLPPQPM
jgi:hypothetical protein